MLVDDHPVWRSAIREILEQKRAGSVVAEVSEGSAVLASAKKARPDVVVMDMGLPGLDGAQATSQLAEALPDVKVLVLSASDDEADVLKAIRAGARGYLLKAAGSAEIVDAVGRVLAGEVVLPPELADVVVRELRDGRPSRLRVVVADPSGVFREGLERVLTGAGFDVVGVGDEAALLDQVEDAGADVVVVDAGLGGGSGEHPVTAVRARHPDVAILVLASGRDAIPPMGPAMYRSFGCVLRDRVHDAEHLAAMLRRVASGEWVVDPDLASALVVPRSETSVLDELSAREREVLALMAEGRSNQAICSQLSLTPKTVEAHVRHIFTKLGFEPAPDDHRRVLAVLAYLRSV